MYQSPPCHDLDILYINALLLIYSRPSWYVVDSTSLMMCSLVIDFNCFLGQNPCQHQCQKNRLPNAWSKKFQHTIPNNQIAVVVFLGKLFAVQSIQFHKFTKRTAIGKAAKAHLVYFNPAESMIRNIIRKRLNRPCCETGPIRQQVVCISLVLPHKMGRKKQKMSTWGASLPSSSDHQEYFAGFCDAFSVGDPDVFSTFRLFSTGILYGGSFFQRKLTPGFKDLGNGSSDGFSWHSLQALARVRIFKYGIFFFGWEATKKQ